MMAGMAAYLAGMLRVVGHDELLARARWWRRWGWTVASAAAAALIVT
jgi:hypothetical protein